MPLIAKCTFVAVALVGCIVIVVLDTVAIAWGDGSGNLECDATFGRLFRVAAVRVLKVGDEECTQLLQCRNGVVGLGVHRRVELLDGIDEGGARDGREQRDHWFDRCGPGHLDVLVDGRLESGLDE